MLCTVYSVPRTAVCVCSTYMVRVTKHHSHQQDQLDTPSCKHMHNVCAWVCMCVCVCACVCERGTCTFSRRAEWKILGFFFYYVFFYCIFFLRDFLLAPLFFIVWVGRINWLPDDQIQLKSIIRTPGETMHIIVWLYAFPRISHPLVSVLWPTGTECFSLGNLLFSLAYENFKYDNQDIIWYIRIIWIPNMYLS